MRRISVFALLLLVLFSFSAEEMNFPTGTGHETENPKELNYKIHFFSPLDSLGITKALVAQKVEFKVRQMGLKPVPEEKIGWNSYGLAVEVDGFMRSNGECVYTISARGCRVIYYFSGNNIMRTLDFISGSTRFGVASSKDAIISSLENALEEYLLSYLKSNNL